MVKPKSNFQTRLISALVLAPVTLIVCWLGGIWFLIGVCLFASVMYWESIVMMVNAVDVRRDAIGIAAIFALGVLVFSSGTPYVVYASIALIVGSFFLVSVHSATSKVVASIAIAVMFSSSLIFLRNIPDNGLAILFFLLFSVWAADVFAYGFGRLIGGPKLMPKVSPNKTWAGFFGGLLGAEIFGILVGHILFGLPLELVVVFALILALAAQAGDLIESAIKRRFRIKDSSNLIPGHGGVMDRVDGLTLAALILVLFYASGVFSI